jgi:hypothetical protein
MTGRAAGFCAGFDRPGYLNPGYGAGRGRGFGRGFGRGMAYRHGWGARGWADDRWSGPIWGPAPQVPGSGSETAALQARLQDLQAELEVLRQRLNELQQEKK